MKPCPHAWRWNADSAAWRVRDPASSRALLNRPELRVRPKDQPAPAALQGSLLGRQFVHWLRQRDDASGSRSKSALTQALNALPLETARVHAQRQAALAGTCTWNHWTWITPVATTASLFGVPLADLSAQKSLLEKMRMIAHGLSGDEVAAADRACAELLMILHQADGPLQDSIRTHAPPSIWRSGDDLAANRLALLWQSYEAGAALLGNALKYMAEVPSARHTGEIQRCLIRTISNGGAVRNTRRFAGSAFSFGSTDIEAEQAFVVDLEGDLGFGSGPHRCPGRTIAIVTLSAALEWVLTSGIEKWPTVLRMLDLPNACIPVFSERREVR